MEKRNFIGIEKNEDYCLMAEKRLILNEYQSVETKKMDAV